MQIRRTDLASEARELWREGAEKHGEPDGVQVQERQRHGCPVTEVKVLNQKGSESLGKPPGRYVTIAMEGLARREDGVFERVCRALAEEIRELLPAGDGEPVLVAGLGNRAITPDAIGPLAVASTMVTRHLIQKLPEHFGSFRPVAAVAAGVLGTTGMETQEIIRGVTEQVRPACIIAVDALASRAMARVCTTVQIADTGIVPGSGVANSRTALNRETLGIPVLALGVPTVVDAGTLAADVAAEMGVGELDEEKLRKFGGSLMVTPRDIDARVAEMAKVIGYGISLALHPGVELDDLNLFLS